MKTNVAAWYFVRASKSRGILGSVANVRQETHRHRDSRYLCWQQGAYWHVYKHTRLHTYCVYIRVYVCIYLYTHTRAEQHDTPWGEKDIYTHTHIHTRHTLHGWPTNLRFYSSSQLFGWLNCYKGTLLRSTVFARYILVHFVYGLWLTRLIRFAMFLSCCMALPAVARIGDQRKTSTLYFDGNEGSRKREKKEREGGDRKKFVRSRAPTRFSPVFFPPRDFIVPSLPPSIRFIAHRTDLQRNRGTKANSWDSIPTFLDSRE